MVPSHTKGETNESGIAELARRLAQNNRIDKVNYLIRNKQLINWHMAEVVILECKSEA